LRPASTGGAASVRVDPPQAADGDPDVGGTWPSAQQVGDDVLTKVFPLLGVAKEAGDVDQDRVEELDELVRVDLEAILVIGQRFGPTSFIRFWMRRNKVLRLYAVTSNPRLRDRYSRRPSASPRERSFFHGAGA
jgi:hypothetical protein